MKCIKCQERQPKCKGYCLRCYYANKRGYKTYEEQLLERNYIKNGEGVLTDKKGNKWFVDLEDFYKYKNVFWNDNGQGYAKRNGDNQYLHKLICNGEFVDHIDRDIYNNHRNNLRSGIYGYNQRRKTGVSGFRGVTKARNKWEAKLMRNKSFIKLGTFDTINEAKDAVIKYVTNEGTLHLYI